MARRAAAGVLVVLVCLLAPFAVAGLWTKQRLLSTDGWAALSGSLADDDEVRRTLGAEISVVVLDAVDAQGRVRRRAEPLVRAAADRALATDAFEAVWVDANRGLHARMIAALEADEGSQVRLDLRPVLALVLDAVEEPLAPVLTLPGDVPELSAPPSPEEAGAVIEAALGRPFADDRATVVVIRDDRIATARTVYRQVDRSAILLAAVTVLLAAAAVALGRDRWKTAAAIGLGSALTLALGWIASLGVGSVVGSFLGEGVGRSVAEASARVAADDLGARYVVTATVLGLAGLACAIVAAVRGRSFAGVAHASAA
ncbi:MAG TPA: hypothetical protein VLA82_02430 [Actinomycetota bacterium]|nr:hypothetical protein [Actinomycetota bacterium]